MAKIVGVSRKQAYQIDMCHGPLLSQIIRFVIPLIISGVLQMLFHSADLIVVGRLASHKALAAVGATASLSMLLINIFIGLSIGTNVLVARYLGEQNRKDISRTVHTAILTSLGGGAILAVVGVIFAKPMLKMMGTPEDILDMSALYMWIFFGGMPAVMLYNFGSAILRAMGDTTRPFYFLLIAGIINVVLNLFFVITFHWDVGGVATATVVSQAIAGVLVLRVLYKMRGPCRFKWQNLRFKWKNMRELLWIGVPAGFQSSCFSLSNILIQSSINKFGSTAIAGITAGGTLEMISYVAHAAIGQAVISFVGQNYGAKNFDRIKRSIVICLVMVIICSVTVSTMLLIFGKPLLAIFNTDPEVIAFGMRRFWCTLPLLFVCASMEVLTGGLRGMGYSAAPTGVTLFFVCVLRVVWLCTVFVWYPTLEIILISYPFTWILNTAGIAWMLKWAFAKEKNLYLKNKMSQV